MKPKDLITAYVLGISPEEVLRHRLSGTLTLTEEHNKQIDCLTKQYEDGFPIQYITGEEFFYGRCFSVNPGVLIPRPDTEVLCEQAIMFTENNENTRILDLCTGSGCIAITLKLETGCPVTAADISESALDTARNNARRLDADIRIIHHDIFTDNMEDCFDLIVSNPPYIRTNDLADLPENVKREPVLALDGGTDGLDFYRFITKKYQKNLSNNGCLMFECGYDQSDDVAGILASNGFSDITKEKDYNGIFRVVYGIKRERGNLIS